MTSSEVSGSPLENFRPSLSLQTYVFGSVKSHDSAASGSGLLPPAGTDEQVLVHVADQLLRAQVVGAGGIERDDLVGRADDVGVGVARRARRACCRRSLVLLPLLSSFELDPHAATPTASIAVQLNIATRCVRVIK